MLQHLYDPYLFCLVVSVFLFSLVVLKLALFVQSS